MADPVNFAGECRCSYGSPPFPLAWSGRGEDAHHAATCYVGGMWEVGGSGGSSGHGVLHGLERLLSLGL